MRSPVKNVVPLWNLASASVKFKNDRAIVNEIRVDAASYVYHEYTTPVYSKFFVSACMVTGNGSHLYICYSHFASWFPSQRISIGEFDFFAVNLDKLLNCSSDFRRYRCAQSIQIKSCRCICLGYFSNRGYSNYWIYNRSYLFTCNITDLNFSRNNEQASVSKMQNHIAKWIDNKGSFTIAIDFLPNWSTNGYDKQLSIMTFTVNCVWFIENLFSLVEMI